MKNVYAVAMILSAFAGGFLIGFLPLLEAKEELARVQDERDRALKELRRPILCTELPRSFMPEMEDAISVRHIMPSTEAVLWYREIEGSPPGLSNSLQEVEPVIAQVRANADGVSYFVWVCPKGSPIKIPR